MIRELNSSALLFEPCGSETEKQKSLRMEREKEDEAKWNELSPEEREVEVKRREKEAAEKKINPPAKGNVGEHFRRKKSPVNCRN